MFNKKGKAAEAMISEQLKDVKECLVSFESFIRAACTTDVNFDTLDALAVSVGLKESTADDSLRSMIDALGEGIYLPSTREDLIDIATMCDKVANKCESAANMVVFQQFTIPTEYDESMIKIMEITHKQFDILESAVKTLFTKVDVLVKDHKILDDIRALESEVDAIEQSLYRKIFKRDMPLAERTQLASFIDLVSDISDITENIADKIQIMLISRKV